MGKVRTSVALRHFGTPGHDHDAVHVDLVSMVRMVQAAATEFTMSPAYGDLIRRILSGDVKVGTRKNHSGRGNVPDVFFPCNRYNMNEMLRALVMGHIETHAVSTGLFQVMGDNPTERDPKTVASLFRDVYPKTALRAPWRTARSHVHRYHDKGQRTPQDPRVPAKIDLSACDGHYLKLEANRRDVTLWFRRLQTAKNVTLTFRLPRGQRFQGNKVCKPTIQVAGGELIFRFTIEKTVADRAPSKVMGVDLGKVEPYTATIINEQENHHSAPFQASRKIKHLNGRYDDLIRRAQHLEVKASRCQASGHRHKASVLTSHAQNIRAAARRVKGETTHQIAHEIAETASKRDTAVALEDLSWLNHMGGRWNHSETQEAITNACRRRGIPVRKVNARDTSNTCTRCGSTVTHNRRNNTCTTCRFTINRDVAASREIALRATRNKHREPLRQRKRQSMTVTHQSAPATTMSGTGPQATMPETSGQGEAHREHRFSRKPNPTDERRENTH